VFAIAAAAAAVVGVVTAVSPMLGIGVAASIVVVVLAFKEPVIGAMAVAFLLWANVPVVAVRSHGVPMPVASAYLLLLLIPAQRYVFRERRGLAMTAGVPWVIALFAISLLSAASSRDPERSFQDVIELALEGVVVYLLTVHAIRDRRALRLVTGSLLAAGAMLGAIALVQQLTGRFDNDFGGFALIDSAFGVGEGESAVAQPRLAGPIGEKNRFGQIMLCLVALGIGASRATDRVSLRRLALAATALSAIGMALTFSRGNAVAFAGLVCCMLLLGTVRRRQVGVLLGVGAVVLLALPQYRQRLATIPDMLSLVGKSAAKAEADGAMRGRATQVLAACLVYIDHPVLGVGPGLFRTYAQEYGNPLGIRRLKGEREAHSLLPQVAAEVGTLGLGAFCALVFVTLRDLLRRARGTENTEDRELANAYFLAVVAYLLCGVFLHLSFIRYFWFLVGIASAATALPRTPVKEAHLEGAA